MVETVTFSLHFFYENQPRGGLGAPTRNRRATQLFIRAMLAIAMTPSQWRDGQRHGSSFGLMNSGWLWPDPT
jgi:hypothetical protein